ncbi:MULTISPECIES: hypothetical protein [unclassified Microcoleus]|uniref:hypothetical protein n=1 Tax=unclassified Microcoleus TaxID=2642155 RepID=UPI002FD7081A
MPPSQRLADLEKALELRYETLGKVKKRLAMTDEFFAKNAIELRIREEVLPELRQCKAEYWELLAEEVRTCEVEVAEVDASYALVEVVPKIERIVNQSSTKYPDELMQKLQEILYKLNEPKTPVAAKLKAALPLVPFIMNYELELDTEILLRRVFERMRQLFKKAIDEKKK